MTYLMLLASCFLAKSPGCGGSDEPSVSDYMVAAFGALPTKRDFIIQQHFITEYRWEYLATPANISSPRWEVHVVPEERGISVRSSARGRLAHLPTKEFAAALRYFRDAIDTRPPCEVSWSERSTSVSFVFRRLPPPPDLQVYVTVARVTLKILDSNRLHGGGGTAQWPPGR